MSTTTPETVVTQLPYSGTVDLTAKDVGLRLASMSSHDLAAVMQQWSRLECLGRGWVARMSEIAQSVTGPNRHILAARLDDLVAAMRSLDPCDRPPFGELEDGK